MHIQAKYAIRAAANRKHWGKLAAKQYATNHGVPAGLYRLARQLRAITEAEMEGRA